ncbi:MAG: alpha/beta hydrolase [Rhodospirillaceae bacterium]
MKPTPKNQFASGADATKSGFPPVEDSRTRSNPLTVAQHLAVVGTRVFFGALCGTVRLSRGAHPRDWRTVRYGLHREEILGYHAPLPGHRPRDAVVFIHGGGWMMGTKDFYSHDLMFLPEAGYPVFNIEYPKAPEHPHPRPLRSLLAALVFIKRSFPEARRVHLMGDSAGGNMAVMAALLLSNPDLLKDVDAWCEPDKLPDAVSVTSLYGVLDRHSVVQSKVPGITTMFEAYAGPRALADDIAPDNAVTPMDLKFDRHPPCFIVCGAEDPILKSSELYARHLQEDGHKVVFKTYAGAFHGFFNIPDREPKYVLRQDIIGFLEFHSAGAPAA